MQIKLVQGYPITEQLIALWFGRQVLLELIITNAQIIQEWSVQSLLFKEQLTELILFFVDATNSNPLNKNFSLQSTSPAKDAGYTSSDYNPVHDFNYNLISSSEILLIWGRLNMEVQV